MEAENYPLDIFQNPVKLHQLDVVWFPMRRSQFLNLVSISPGMFNVLQARNLLPFSGARPKGWGDYSAHDAFRLRLFLALSAAGKSQPEAAATVKSQYEELLDEAHQTPGAEVWFGTFSAVTTVIGEPSSTAVLPLHGSLGSLEASIAQTLAQGDLTTATVQSISVISATAVLAKLLNDARGLGIAVEELAQLGRRFGVSP